MSEEPESSRNSAGTIIAVVLPFSVGYAILRYHIFGPILWKDFPFFILNKGVLEVKVAFTHINQKIAK